MVMIFHFISICLMLTPESSKALGCGYRGGYKFSIRLFRCLRQSYVKRLVNESGFMNPNKHCPLLIQRQNMTNIDEYHHQHNLYLINHLQRSIPYSIHVESPEPISHLFPSHLFFPNPYLIHIFSPTIIYSQMILG